MVIKIQRGTFLAPCPYSSVEAMMKLTPLAMEDAYGLGLSSLPGDDAPQGFVLESEELVVAAGVDRSAGRMAGYRVVVNLGDAYYRSRRMPNFGAALYLADALANQALAEDFLGVMAAYGLKEE